MLHWKLLSCHKKGFKLWIINIIEYWLSLSHRDLKTIIRTPLPITIIIILSSYQMQLSPSSYFLSFLPSLLTFFSFFSFFLSSFLPFLLACFWPFFLALAHFFLSEFSFKLASWSYDECNGHTEMVDIARTGRSLHNHIPNFHCRSCCFLLH